jgi:Glycosyl hydrolase family 26
MAQAEDDVPPRPPDDELVPEPTPTPTRSTVPTPTPLPNGGPDYSLPLQPPGPIAVPRVTNARDLAEIAAIQAKQSKFPTYAAWRRLAEIYLKNGVFSEAVKAWRTEAKMYRAAGLTDAALVQEQLAARYETTVQLFLERQPTDSEQHRLHTNATLEPVRGCYLGAFIDRDDGLTSKYHDENWQEHGTNEEFTQKTGVTHAVNFMYVSYGQKFPAVWIESCKKSNVIPHIAWEPRSLREVQNNAYLQNWAKSCRDAQWPIFIRFAGEMNGFWTPYHKDAKLYREKFRLMHSVIKKTAPQVATIWCVNSVPPEIIEKYYPGDDSCDWVGVNLYSVPFYDSDPKRPASMDSPVSLVEPVYELYAARKPIAICEYGASRMSKVDMKDRTEFAIDKMSQLYSALPRLFPRVKSINWFSMNTMRHAKAGRQLNNYQLTGKAALLKHYQQIAASPYFLSQPKSPETKTLDLPFPLTDGQQISASSTQRFSIWAKSYVARPRVYFQVDGKTISASNGPGAQTITLEAGKLNLGHRTLTVLLFDDKSRYVGSLARKILVVP